HAKAGRWFLKDMPALRWLVYQGRTFHPPLTDRKWQRAQGITDAKSLSGTLYYIKSEGMQITFSVPRDYPKEKDFESKLPRPDPLPLLVTMHDKEDYTEKYPGEALMDRRFGDKDIWDSLYKEWLVLAPMSSAGVFVTKTGSPRGDAFQNPLSVFWRHYHVDFDRMILDGSEQAFTMANSMPVFWSGIVFRGKWKLSEDQLALVKNFASVPVYVVDNLELGKQLEDAGHPAVTKGIANKSLMEWMAKQRRVWPRKIEWNAARSDNALPYWINIDSANWGPGAKREIRAEVIDTPDNPNTIKIEATSAIDTVSLFLNDDIVDLDRKVRVIINGHVEYDALLKIQDERLECVGRDFDFLFNRDPLLIRDSMYFGWLTPSRIVQMVVRPPEEKVEPKKDEPAKDEGPQATAEDEVIAERLMGKARDLVEAGTIDRAIELLERILGMPKNKQTTAAGELLAKIK
ncbi:MAG: hypothetical protein O2894_12965, partial [Planctomycetota bacterium]|nr:hypothetical protein [Planctomycetota bacterium]